jgi:dethiobiotin synthetase
LPGIRSLRTPSGGDEAGGIGLRSHPSGSAQRRRGGTRPSDDGAIAPHIAAREANRVIDLAVLDRCYERLSLQSDVMVVEGAGGWLAPIDDTHSFADLAVRWNLDVVLVVGLRLGCLNHALLTVDAVQRTGLRLCGWIGNSIDAVFERRAENLATLRARIAAPCLAEFPYAPASDARAAAKDLLQSLSNLNL